MKTILASVCHFFIIWSLGSNLLNADTFSNVIIGGGAASNSSLVASGGTASGAGSITLNYGYSTGNGSFSSSSVTGHTSTASGFSSFAMDGGYASAVGSFAMGYATASPSYVVSTVTPTGTCSFAISGGYITGPYSFAGGRGNSAATNCFSYSYLGESVGNYSATFGYTTYANAAVDFVVGAYNVGLSSTGTATSATTWVPGDPLFEIGNGTISGTTVMANNALTVYKSGNATFTGTVTVTGTGGIMTTTASISATDIPMFGH